MFIILAKSGDVREVDAAIREADFVCILYDTNVIKTRDNVEAVWIPRIKKIREGLMVFLHHLKFKSSNSKYENVLIQLDSTCCCRNQI